MTQQDLTPTDGTVFYYLHAETGDLIGKRERPEPSDFVKRVWQLKLSDRMQGWLFLIEAFSQGAKPSRIAELAEQWGMDLRDFIRFLNNYADRFGPPPQALANMTAVYAKGMLDIDLQHFLKWLVTHEDPIKPSEIDLDAYAQHAAADAAASDIAEATDRRAST